jgi:hypothetical protein
MEPFSVRIGAHSPSVDVQTDEMDGRLRNGLWTAFVTFFAGGGDLSLRRFGSNPGADHILKLLWTEYFGQRVDAIPATPDRALSEIRGRYLASEWYEAYEFVEFGAEHLKHEGFVKECNRVLERDRSAFRFAGLQLVPVTDARDLAAVQRAMDDTTADKLGPVRHHLETAVRLFSDRESPDYRNSIKESVSAVESLVNLINGGKKADPLGTAVKKLDPKLHPAFEDGLKKLYGWSSDQKTGIRHALMDEPNVGFEEAQFMLVLASGFVSFLVARAAKDGVI